MAGRDPKEGRECSGLQQPQLWLCSPSASQVPQLNMGKKMSTPQDLMIEELSLHNNRGSQLFQQRQRRMQRFVLEHPSSYREVGEDDSGQQSYHSELHVAASPQGVPPEVPKKTEKVLQMSKVLNPDALAPGYSSPLKEVPPEKFNVTAIPKGYRSPWQDLFGDKDSTVQGLNQPPVRPPPWDFNTCHRTPAPFDRALVSDLFSVPALELDNLSALEVISHRPNFNRTAQGWVRFLPESEEL
ncbi:myozenin-3 isoform X2 [Calypte anna]|uniref:myozenin-3 isoform X2 n=1 Tax=Calypte anna TaxID=9244 RepID=UPI0011C361B2|nr:myozenin-3 isoform X2 [Calypte anna]